MFFSVSYVCHHVNSLFAVFWQKWIRLAEFFGAKSENIPRAYTQSALSTSWWTRGSVVMFLMRRIGDSMSVVFSVVGFRFVMFVILVAGRCKYIMLLLELACIYGAAEFTVILQFDMIFAQAPQLVETGQIPASIVYIAHRSRCQKKMKKRESATKNHVKWNQKLEIPRSANIVGNQRSALIHDAIKNTPLNAV